ncbi:DUF397 domain-containing protein [Streptomyces alboniger]|uniref:DUF397 domain-containing protein n=1 Tax=Streptomyces alboniger TaxID=132473 RepID=A0A5J6HKK5_STRAD|nr:DUF397 domain-containing protein [Streptomyces alboniger]QEV18890.1 DUF397 domain-containing protein [Streptomyces alboniger]
MNRHWQKSSYCSEGSSCVHVAATTTGTVELTESSDPTGTIVRTTPRAFAALIRTAKQPAGAEPA